MKFKGYQLAMGFGISIPLLLIAVAVGWIIRKKQTQDIMEYQDQEKKQRLENLI